MKRSRRCQCWSGSSCAPTNKGPPTEQAGTSLGLSTLSSLSAAGKGRWLHLGGILPTKGQAGLPAWRWQLKVSWLRHNLSPPEHSSLNASALQFALENSLLKCQVQPKLHTGCLKFFSPIFAHGPLPPSDGGGGHIQFSQKHNFWSIMCIF